MKFEEQFPSLMNGEYTLRDDIEFSRKEIEEHCLDSQRVKEILLKYSTRSKSEAQSITHQMANKKVRDTIKKIIEELELE